MSAPQFCRSCGAGIGYYRRPGEGTCPRCSLRILIACEASGTIRDIARLYGHEAWSCDLLGPGQVPAGFEPSEWSTIWDRQAFRQYHVTGDCRQMLWRNGIFDEPWDIIIAHPPCTYLANSGARWLYVKGTRTPIPERWRLMKEGAAFFDEMAELAGKAQLGSVLENPVMHGHASSLLVHAHSRRKQTIQPFQFGTPESKATVLWLDRLPDLEPHRVLDRKEARGRVHLEPPKENRWWYRSLTDPNIAAHMIHQWGAWGYK